MGRFRLLVLLLFFNCSDCENEPTSNEDSFSIESLLNQNEALEHERYARHVEATVTESIVNHLMKEIRQLYPRAKTQTKSFNKILKIFQRKLENYSRRKKSRRTRTPKRIGGNKGRKRKEGKIEGRSNVTKLNRNEQKSVINETFGN